MTLPLPYVIDAPDVQGNFDALATQFPVGAAQIQSALAVTSLPATPVNGQEIYYVADATNGVIWHLKYRAASASTYKWEFVGGAELSNNIDTGENTASGVFVNLTTVGPDITVPLAGDYDYVLECKALNAAAAIVTPSIGLNIAGVAPIEPDTARMTLQALNHYGPLHRSNRKTGLTAATLLRAQYASAGGTAVTYQQRRLRVHPVRVG